MRAVSLFVYDVIYSSQNITLRHCLLAVNCQKACKKCDDARPCPRCVKYGIEATCVNSVRKERKKGVKRGPYKQRKGQGSSTII